MCCSVIYFGFFFEPQIFILLELYHIIGNPQAENESYRLHDTFTQMLLKDHFQSTQLSEHRLIQVM